MSTNDSPFSPEELASFIEVTPPETPAAAPAPVVGAVSPLEMQQMLDHQRNQFSQEIRYMRNELQQRPIQETNTGDTETSQIPIQFDKDGKAFVDPDAVGSLVEQAADRRLMEKIAPLAPALADLQQNKSVRDAVTYLQQTAPEVLQGQDPNMMGRMAIDFFNSSFNMGRTPDERANYAVGQLRQFAQTRSLPMSTGAESSSFSGQTMPAYNQTGRTPGGSGTPPGAPIDAPKGGTVRLKAQSINDLGGIEAMQEYARHVDSVYDYNRRYNMGWKIVTE